MLKNLKLAEWYRSYSLWLPQNKQHSNLEPRLTINGETESEETKHACWRWKQNLLTYTIKKSFANKGGTILSQLQTKSEKAAVEQSKFVIKQTKYLEGPLNHKELNLH